MTFLVSTSIVCDPSKAQESIRIQDVVLLLATRVPAAMLSFHLGKDRTTANRCASLELRRLGKSASVLQPL